MLAPHPSFPHGRGRRSNSNRSPLVKVVVTIPTRTTDREQARNTLSDRMWRMILNVWREFTWMTHASDQRLISTWWLHQ